MDEIKFPIPMDPKKMYQSVGVLTSIIEYIRIILKRIKEEKELHKKFQKEGKFAPYLLPTLALDMKSLYIFSKIYLDYFISYITLTFFPDYDLKYRSMKDHIKSLKRTSNDDPHFENYKNYVLSCENQLKLRIRYVRDKFITHRKLRTTESYLFDDQTNNFLILFDNSKDPANIDNEFKEKIINLGKKYNIEREHDKSQISDFIYLDLILAELESTEITFEQGDLNLIEELRNQLGMVINEDNVYEFLYNFSEIIGNILKEINPDISRHYIWRFPL